MPRPQDLLAKGLAKEEGQLSDVVDRALGSGLAKSSTMRKAAESVARKQLQRALECEEPKEVRCEA